MGAMCLPLPVGASPLDQDSSWRSNVEIMQNADPDLEIFVLVLRKKLSWFWIVWSWLFRFFLSPFWHNKAWFRYIWSLFWRKIVLHTGCIVLHCATSCYIVTLCTLCYIQVAVTVHGEECALTRFLHCKYSAQNILNILLEISIVWTFLSGLARPKHWETFTFQTKASKDCDSFNWSTKRSFEMWKLQQRSQNQIEARGFSDQGRPLAAL